ncbi:uncharacterized protein LOC118558028 [Fundulus heteroclitus]|uniref:uncharacterized protein LOC118558028 n=1 Tax=Fundulus heteroclitus TaxID=8078 RepID=UPI00165ADF6D|nr:uncharacterized protein LOC118558028 [Fundulus heteroclitus]
MKSSGLVLLLLFSFLICSLSVPHASNQQDNRALQKRGNTAKKVKTAAEYFLKIVTALKPFIALIPGAGDYLSAIIDVANNVAGTSPEKQLLAFLKAEFDNLNLKIDENQKQLEWNIWSSGQYGDLEKKISVAWNKMQDLLNNCPEPCAVSLRKDGKDKVIENFFKKAEKYVGDLHFLIVDKGGYNPDYAKLLKDHVRCHEKSIKIYSAINAALVYKAITMTHFYNRFNNIATDKDSLAKKAYEISAAMFQIQKNCISEPDAFVALDVQDRIKPPVKRTDLAQEIRKYLDYTYDRYDWMVVAYYPNPHTLKKWMEKKILTGFTSAEKGEIGVAVAKQAQGTHKKTNQVITAIKGCFDETVKCDKVETKLENCAKDVDGIKVKEMYSAINAYVRKSHDSVEALKAEEAPTEDLLDPKEENKIPYIYTGRCRSLKGLDIGSFRVLIKSDEEWMKVGSL